jgi:hypothetical protein
LTASTVALIVVGVVLVSAAFCLLPVRALLVVFFQPPTHYDVAHQHVRAKLAGADFYFCAQTQHRGRDAEWFRARGEAMNMTFEQNLISKLRTLSPQQVAEVEDFVEFLAAKSKKRAALDRLLSIAPALAAAGVEPLSEDEIDAEVQAARAERRARQAAHSTDRPAAKDSGADRS